MNGIVVAVAQYAVILVALGGVVTWLLVGRGERFGLAVQAILAAILVGALVKVAGLVHADPRPFVVDPALHPLFPHPRDNGFPSDHTALAAAIALVVARYRWKLGVLLLTLSVAIGAARVAAHVHHVQDVVAGFLIGVIAAVVAVVVWQSWVRRGGSSQESGEEPSVVEEERLPGRESPR